MMFKNTGLRYLWSSNSESCSIVELKMDVTVVNGPKTWSEFGSCPGALHEFWDQKFELKMALPALNGPKSWSSFGSDVTFS